MGLVESEPRYIENDKVWRIETHDARNQLLGGLYFKENKDKSLKLLYISVQSPGKGVGGQLLDALITFAQHNGFIGITGDFLPVPESSVAAEQLYRSRGFQVDHKKHTICQYFR